MTAEYCLIGGHLFLHQIAICYGYIYSCKVIVSAHITGNSIASYKIPGTD